MNSLLSIEFWVYTLFSAIPLILFVDYRFFNSALGTKTGWLMFSSLIDESIKKDAAHYRVKQYFMLWIAAFYAGSILIWFMTMMGWIGLFRDGLYWQAESSLIFLLKCLIEAGFIAFVILLLRIGDLPCTHRYKKALLQTYGRTKATQLIQRGSREIFYLGLLFNWALGHIYYLIFGEMELLQGGTSLIIWHWF